MNRSEFLMALYDALDGLPSQVRTDAVSEYQEFFRSEMLKGRTEEDIALSLGDPITLAYAIKNRRGYHQNSEPVRNAPRRSSFPKIAVWVIVAIVITMMMSGIGAAVSFVKGWSWGNIEFGFGTKYDVNEVKEADWDGATKIEIHITSTSTKVVASESKKVKASLTGYVKTANKDNVPTLELTRSGDVISIVEKRKSFSVMGSYSSNMKLDIDIPKSFTGDITFEGASGNFTTSTLELKNLNLKLASGNIALDDISLSEDLNASCTSGNMTFNDISADSAVLKVTSGNKEFRNFSISGDVESNTSSGNTRIENMSCNKLSVECASGDINVSNISADRLQVSSLSGNVTVRELAGALSVKATSGNVDVSVSGPKDELSLTNLSGNITLSLPSDTGFSLDSKVGSGTISCSFDLDDEDSDKRSLSGRNGNGKIPVTIKTTSGNININKR